MTAQTNLSETFDVIVIGGGLAGLAAGATAAQAGARTVVLEGHQPGGRARVMERDGFTFNMGAHALYVNGAGWQVLSRLGLRPVGSPPPLTGYRIRYRSEHFLLPSSAGTLLRTKALPLRAKAQIGRLLGRLPRMKADAFATTSVTDWLASQYLRPEACDLVTALVRIGTYSSRHDELSAATAISQLQAAVRHGVIYLDGGWQQLIDGLAQHVEVRAGTNVRRLEPDTTGVAVVTDTITLVGRRVVVATGAPVAVKSILPEDPDWGDLGDAVTAACLDAAVRRVPTPGYVLGVDDAAYATTQSPPARQAPPGQAVVSVLRYGASEGPDGTAADRVLLQRYLAYAGVRPEDVAFDRFLARMVVAGTQPLARLGGFAGRPTIGASGHPNVYLAGDWVGPTGLLADAALASGHTAGVAAATAAVEVRNHRPAVHGTMVP